MRLLRIFISLFIIILSSGFLSVNADELTVFNAGVYDKKAESAFSQIPYGLFKRGCTVFTSNDGGYLGGIPNWTLYVPENGHEAVIKNVAANEDEQGFFHQQLIAEDIYLDSLGMQTYVFQGVGTIPGGVNIYNVKDENVSNSADCAQYDLSTRLLATVGQIARVCQISTNFDNLLISGNGGLQVIRFDPAKSDSAYDQAVLLVDDTLKTSWGAFKYHNYIYDAYTGWNGMNLKTALGFAVRDDSLNILTSLEITFPETFAGQDQEWRFQDDNPFAGFKVVRDSFEVNGTVDKHILGFLTYHAYNTQSGDAAIGLSRFDIVHFDSNLITHQFTNYVSEIGIIIDSSGNESTGYIFDTTIIASDGTNENLIPLATDIVFLDVEVVDHYAFISAHAFDSTDKKCGLIITYDILRADYAEMVAWKLYRPHNDSLASTVEADISENTNNADAFPYMSYRMAVSKNLVYDNVDSLWKTDGTYSIFTNPVIGNADTTWATLWHLHFKPDANKVQKHQYLLGDIDNNGLVNASDAIFLYHYLMFPHYGIAQPVGRYDVNNDARISVSDFYLLSWYILKDGNKPGETCNSCD